MEQQSAVTGAGISRGSNAVYVVPADWSAAGAALATAMDRLDADLSTTQLLVVVATPDAAVAVTQALVAARGNTTPRIVAATGAARVARLLRAGAAPVVVGAPEQLLALLRMSVLKLDGLRALAIGWVEDILAAGRAEDLEAILADVPKEASRIILTAKWDAVAEDFAERHARRAAVVHLSAPGTSRQETAPTTGVAQPSVEPSVSYVLCAASARPTALRMVLDEIDPPSALVYSRSDLGDREVRETLTTLGYGDGASVRMARGEVAEHASLVVLYDLPQTPTEWRTATSGRPVRVVALVAPRLLPQLRTLAAGPIAPLSYAAPFDAARAREAQLRADLRRELTPGTPARELLTLEPLLLEFDGAALAAAALRLLDLERMARARSEAAVSPAPPSQDVPRPFGPPNRNRERRGHDRGDRGSREPRGGGRAGGGTGPKDRRPSSARPLPRNPR